VVGLLQDDGGLSGTHLEYRVVRLDAFVGNGRGGVALGGPLLLGVGLRVGSEVPGGRAGRGESACPGEFGEDLEVEVVVALGVSLLV